MRMTITSGPGAKGILRFSNVDCLAENTKLCTNYYKDCLSIYSVTEKGVISLSMTRDYLSPPLKYVVM